MLDRIANASTEGEYLAAIVHLQGSQAWTEHGTLRDWIGRFWLPMHQVCTVMNIHELTVDLIFMKEHQDQVELSDVTASYQSHILHSILY